MTLAFTQKINEKPTYFLEKIWACLHYQIGHSEEFEDYNQKFKEKFKASIFVNFGVTHPKRHTIRQDKSNRWKSGNKIHPVINNRTSDRFQFAPTLRCVATQTIKISYKEKDCEKQCCEPAIYIDDKPIDFETLINLAKNDGFDTVVDFLTYFNKDFTGKIIHWTNLKY